VLVARRARTTALLRRVERRPKEARKVPVTAVEEEMGC